jgi:hypothetical protein
MSKRPLKTFFEMISENAGTYKRLDVAEARRLMESADSRKYDGLKFEIVLIDTDVVNQNNRMYNKMQIESAMNRKSELMENGGFFGEADHPIVSKEDPSALARFTTIFTKNASHRILESRWEGNKLIGLCETLQTERGKEMKNLLLQGVPVAMSMRALGRGTNRGDGVTIFESGLNIITFDYVANPSHKNAIATRIITESFLMEFIDAEQNKMDLLSESIGGMGGDVFVRAKDITKDTKFAGNEAIVCANGECMLKMINEGQTLMPKTSKTFTDTFNEFLWS